MAVAITMPKLGLSMETGTVVVWRKREGDSVHAGEVVLEVETDKITTDVESPVAGTLLKILVGEGTESKVQANLCVIGTLGEDISEFLLPGTTEPLQADSSVAPGPSSEQESASDGFRITPRARKLLSERGFAPSVFEGRKGRISEEDVAQFIAQQDAGHAGAHLTAAAAAGAVRPMSKIEKVTAARLTQSFRDVPQFSVRFTAAMDRARSLRAARKISINDLLMRAVAIALAKFPIVQCQYRPEGIYTPAEVNIGFAVALGNELVVPVIHNADKKTVAEIAGETTVLVAKAKERKLQPADISGGTFTVSNLGMYGITSFTPIVNPGEGAILGVGAVQDVACANGEAVAVANVVELTLVCDHRSVSGATAAEFCRTLKTVIETEEASSW